MVVDSICTDEAEFVTEMEPIQVYNEECKKVPSIWDDVRKLVLYIL